MKRSVMVALCVVLVLFVLLVGCSKDERLKTEENSNNGFYEEEDFPRSPRIPVNGILAKPGLAWAAIIVMDNDSTIKLLASEDGEQVYRVLSAMEAEVVLTPFHYEGQHSDPLFTIMIEYADDPGTGEVIYSTESGIYFYRFTDTVGDQEDKGYVGGFSEELYEILAAYF